MEQFKYLESAKEVAKCDTEFRRRIGIANDAIQKLIKLLRSKDNLLETKNGVMNCNGTSFL